MRRNYHNLAAHYNVYFNGKESLKAGISEIEDANKDDYTQLLTIFPDSKQSSKEVATGEMDVAIQKGVKLIKVHSMRVKPKKRDDDNSVKYEKFYSQNEFNKWVDNAYLMMGKAYFFKHDYATAQQNFNYIFREFRPGPEWYEAEIYSIRVAIERGDFSSAKMLLDNYNVEGLAPEGLNGFFAASYADFYLRQNKLNEAVPFLEDAAKKPWSKYYKIRLNFILAQLYHKLGQYKEASITYQRVIKFHPSYEMAFNAKVNRASVIFGEGGLPAVQKEIRKLLKDSRNKDYQDQIYYALAKAYQAENMENEAVNNFKISTQKSTTNSFQKGLSFYELAKIYYSKPKYRTTYYYLDSALVGLTKEDVYYQDANDLHEKLSTLVQDINQVEREDSLQRIAAMPEEERMAFIENLIKEEMKKQEEQKELAELQSQDDFSNANTSSSSSGGWYFYNSKVLASGKSDFEKRWGDRKLEDNWRRSNKEVVVEDVSDVMDAGLPDFESLSKKEGTQSTDSLANKAGEATSKKSEGDDLSDPLKYLTGLPLTAEKMAESDSIIEESLISMGVIYKDQLENIPFAIDAFLELMRRFPASKYLEDALMNLYVCYEVQKDSAQMLVVRKQLEEKFPNGDFTNFLNDPDFFVKRKARLQKIENMYQSAYEEYLSNQFELTIQKYKEVLDIDNKNELIPKFKFIAGLSYGKTGDFNSFEKELTSVVTKYPDNEVTPVAKKILEQYKKGRKPTVGSTQSRLKELRNDELTAEIGDERSLAGDKSAYVVQNNAIHSLIILYNKEADFNRLRYNIADYNFSKFLLNDYNMTSFRLPDGSPVFVVSGFKNRLEAMDYFYSIRDRSDLFEVANLKQYQLYAINDVNTKHLLSSGDVNGYDAFFKENYLSAEAVKEYEREESKNRQDKKSDKQVKKKSDSSLRKVSGVEAETKTDVSKIEKKESLAEEQTKKDAPVKNLQEEKKENIPVNASENKEKEPDKSSVKDENASVGTKVEASSEVENEDAGVVEAPEQQASVNFEFIEGPHNALVLFKKGRINIQQVGKIFTNYTKNFVSSDLVVDFGPRSTGYLYVKISGFKSSVEARDYLQKVEVNEYLMGEIGRMQPYFWAITDNNFSLLTNEERIKLYEKFYESHYKKEWVNR